MNNNFWIIQATENTHKQHQKTTLRLTHENIMNSNEKRRLFGCPFVIPWNSSNTSIYLAMYMVVLGPQRNMYKRYLKESPLAIQNWIIGLMLPFSSEEHSSYRIPIVQTFYLHASFFKIRWSTLNCTKIIEPMK